MPFFSVIIPSHQRPEFLQRAIESVLSQTFKDFEVIVIVDGNDDLKTTNAEDNDPRLKWKNSPKSGRSAARNKGIDSATGQYLCFLDDDDQYDENLLMQFYQQLKALHFPDKVIVRTALLHIHEDGKEHKGSHYIPSRNPNVLSFLLHNMCSVGTCCFPAGALSGQRFDERFSFWEDTHFLMRVMAGKTMVQMDNWLYRYHYHPAMGSKQMKQLSSIVDNNLAAICDYRDNYRKQWLPYLTDKDFKIVLAQKYLMYAVRACRAGDKKFGYQCLQNSLSQLFLGKSWRMYLLFWAYYLSPKNAIHG